MVYKNKMNYGSKVDLFRKAFGRYKLQLTVLTLLGVVSAFTESLGVTALIPLFSRLAGQGTSDDIGSRIIGNALDLFNVGFAFKFLLAIIILAFIFKALALWLFNYFSARVTADYEYQTRSDLLRGVFSADWFFLMRQKVGYLETIILRDISIARNLFSIVSGAMMNLASLAIYVAIALSISGTITLISLTLGGLIFLVLKPLLYKTKMIARHMAKLYSEMNHHVGEKIIGIKTVKTSSVEEVISSKADDYFEEIRNLDVKVAVLGVAPAVIMEPISILFIVSIFTFLYVTDNFQIGVFAATMYLIHRIFGDIRNVQMLLYKANERIPYVERVIEFQEEVAKNRESDGGTNRFEFKKCLEFKNLDFTYESSKNVLSNLNFVVKKGEMLGIVGKSGAGKTTIVDLFLRLMQPTRGKILIDGTDISAINIKEWRNNIGYVSQDIFVLNDTFENNIRFYDESISDEVVCDSAKMAYIFDFIQSKANQFKTAVGERGVLLSGGEKQRLVLARVLARHPSILILDEATSALDNESELMIQRAIEGLKGRVTIFVIAHRLTTLLNCDKIIFLENGRNCEEGPPQELLKDKDSNFFQLYNIRNQL